MVVYYNIKSVYALTSFSIQMGHHQLSKFLPQPSGYSRLFPAIYTRAYRQHSSLRFRSLTIVYYFGPSHLQ
jgi:hypothetical protein